MRQSLSCQLFTCCEAVWVDCFTLNISAFFALLFWNEKWEYAHYWKMNTIFLLYFFVKKSLRCSLFLIMFIIQSWSLIRSPFGRILCRLLAFALAYHVLC
ncbi:hypothetical protein SAY86_015905 [Trapa natans]|uniref:Uncharacterized protein n=1 Tax=Trapa natans TaxID=22666 RepID=A0AAN7R0U5_TRANT|nr:hypothetical protein SAY86_015905 [Trapa natans]